MNKKVTILLSIYKPNVNWLIALLKSINNQTYKNIEILICEDCPLSPVDKNIFSKHLTNFKYTIITNNKNIGSNKSFELLTKLSTGDYLAYCDQDDIWEKNKISLLVEDIEKNNAVLSFSDMYVIDENNNCIADSISHLRKRQKGLSGNNLSPIFITRNFISGCSMLIRSNIAKEALPFASYLIHDHWLALYASSKGFISFVNTPLIGYRQHSNNQTSVLMNVETKNDYLKNRILLPQKNLLELRQRFKNNEHLLPIIEKTIKWNNYRENWWKKFDLMSFLGLIKYAKINPFSTIFELSMARMPYFIFSISIKLIKSGKI